MRALNDAWEVLKDARAAARRSTQAASGAAHVRRPRRQPPAIRRAVLDRRGGPAARAGPGPGPAASAIYCRLVAREIARRDRGYLLAPRSARGQGVPGRGHAAHRPERTEAEPRPTACRPAWGLRRAARFRFGGAFAALAWASWDLLEDLAHPGRIRARASASASRSRRRSGRPCGHPVIAVLVVIVGHGDRPPAPFNGLG